jgi:phosphoglycerate dehydrogenase-like enzyme
VTRVLNLGGRALAERISAMAPGIEVVRVRRDEPVPSDLSGDVLVAMPGAAPAIALLAPRVRWVHAFGTGIDWLPPEALAAPMLTCARGGSAVAISEFVLAAMLAFEKQLPELWSRPEAEVFTPAELGTLSGRHLSLVGLGGIGAAVATRAQAFGMSVSALRRHGGPSPLAGVQPAGSVSELVAEADHLVVAAPATAETHHIIGTAALGSVKPGVHLVNIARGSLVDQEALRAALDDGRVARATLDVSDPEPLPTGHWLYHHPRVRLTGHISWSSPAGLEPLTRAFLDNLARFVAGSQLVGVVDPAERY